MQEGYDTQSQGKWIPMAPETWLFGVLPASPMKCRSAIYAPHSTFDIVILLLARSPKAWSGVLEVHLRASDSERVDCWIENVVANVVANTPIHAKSALEAHEVVAPRS